MATTYATGSSTATQNAIIAFVNESSVQTFNDTCLQFVTEGWNLQGAPFTDGTNYFAQYYKRSKSEDSQLGANPTPLDERKV